MAEQARTTAVEPTCPLVVSFFVSARCGAAQIHRYISILSIGHIPSIPFYIIACLHAQRPFILESYSQDILQGSALS